MPRSARRRSKRKLRSQKSRRWSSRSSAQGKVRAEVSAHDRPRSDARGSRTCSIPTSRSSRIRSRVENRATRIDESDAGARDRHRRQPASRGAGRDQPAMPGETRHSAQQPDPPKTTPTTTARTQTVSVRAPGKVNAAHRGRDGRRRPQRPAAARRSSAYQRLVENAVGFDVRARRQRGRREHGLRHRRPPGRQGQRGIHSASPMDRICSAC